MTSCKLTVRSQYKRIMCAGKVAEEMAGDLTRMTECECYPPCHEVVYDAAYSLSQWPGKGFEGAAVWHDIFDDGTFLRKFNSCKSERELYAEYFALHN